MSRVRRYRLITVIFAMCTLVLSQAALAAYACPGLERALEVAQMAKVGMPCADTTSLVMDRDQPGLCEAHCEAPQLSADNYQLPPLASLDQMGAVLTVAANSQQRSPHELQVPLLRREAGPPLAVRHCCFRI